LELGTLNFPGGRNLIVKPLTTNHWPLTTVLTAAVLILLLALPSAAAALVEKVYPGYGNLIRLQLTEDGGPADLSGVTGAALVLNGRSIIASTPAGGALTWSQSGYLPGELRLALNALSPPLTPGFHAAWLILYSSDYPAGLVWETQLQLEVMPAGPN
jgi:hypothetical protein